MSTCPKTLLRSFALMLVCLGSGLFSAEKPNIIIFLFDDLGYGQPTCYNDKSLFKTPSIDLIATQGMRFTDAHSPSAVCTPTRYGILTGRMPSRIGQYGVLTTYSPPLIPPTRMTIASMLKAKGYNTASIGKWHLGLDWQKIEGQGGKGNKKNSSSSAPIGSRLKSGPLALGFDTFWGFTHARNFGMIIEQDVVTQHLEEVEVQPKQIERAIAYVTEQAKKKQPFFLYFPVCPPHTPIVPAPQYVGKGGGAKGDQAYSDWVFQGDDMLGQIMTTLDKLKIADDTLLIVTSDNGAEGRAYAPLRESKRSIYEGGHRVPFIARWPGHIKPGSTSNLPTMLTDLMATVAELTDVTLPDDAAEDSCSILSTLLGKGNAERNPSVISQSMKGDLAIRENNLKLVVRTTGKRELYDLDADISETKDLSAQQADKTFDLVKQLRHFMEVGRTRPGPPQESGSMKNLKVNLGEK